MMIKGDGSMDRKKITLGSISLSKEKAAQLEEIKQQKLNPIKKSFVKPGAGRPGRKKPFQKPISELGKTVKFLYKRYPKLFIKDRSKPLKCGIEKDIFADLGDKPDATKRMIKKALRHYVFSFPYMNATLKATHRYDLQGEPVEEISEEHKTFATEWVKERESEKKESDSKK